MQPTQEPGVGALRRARLEAQTLLAAQGQAHARAVPSIAPKAGQKKARANKGATAYGGAALHLPSNPRARCGGDHVSETKYGPPAYYVHVT
jgi:hypothetical protein